MAIRIPIITDLQDKGIKDAKKAFGDFKAAVANAEGGLGKFKAGSKVAFDAVAANAATFAVAAGAAVGKFVFDGMAAFQDLAISAGKFADATGLAVQDASRYIEAAGDIGIPIDAVEGAIGRLNKTIGADPDKVRKLGIDLVYLKDGSLDVNKTFLNTIDRLKKIKDPAEKARVAAQLLGKGWQQMAELIEMGADDLSASLKEVSEQKVISEAELQMAREYRAAMDGLGDSVDDLQIKSGQRLIPLATMLANGAAAALDFDDKVTELFKDIVGNGTQAEKEVSDLAGVLNEGRISAGEFKTAIQNAETPLDNLTIAAGKAKTAIGTAEAAWKNLIGQFEREVSFDQLDADLILLRETAIAAFKGGKEEMDAFHAQQLVVAESFALFAANFPPELSTQLSIEINSMDLERLERAANLIKFLESPIGSGGVDPSIYRRVSTPLVAGARASGGPVTGGSSYLVGERGPELFTPGTSGNITPNNALGGSSITINVNGGDPNSIVRALQQYVRQSGPIPVNTRAM
jgi:hypothetical protein